MDSKESSLLPFELLEEILCRVPTQSLIRFKLRCKRWLALFQDQRFIYKHLALIDQEQNIRTNDMDKIINLVTGAFSSFSLPQEFIAVHDIFSMIHCNGLLSCILDSGSMAVWNPCLNQVKWIEPLASSPVCCCHSFGYDGLSRDGYKILRFVNGIFTENEPANMASYKPYVYIYEFRSSSWKTFQVSLDWHVVWRCKDTFESLCSMPFMYDVTTDVVALSAFRGDNLSLLHKSKGTTTIQVWVTDKIEKGVITLWTKFFSVTRPDYPVLCADADIASPVHFIDKNNRIVVCCEGVMADGTNVPISVYLIEDGEIKRQAGDTSKQTRI